MKINSKQWIKVRVSIKNKTLTATKQVFKTMTEGSESITSTNSNFAIMNKTGILKLVADGYTVSGLELDTPVTEPVKSSWTPPFIVGDPKLEAEIQAYYNKKKAVSFVTDVTERRKESMKTALEVLGQTRFEKQQPINMNKAFERFERSRIGQERKQQEVK